MCPCTSSYIHKSKIHDKNGVFSFKYTIIFIFNKTTNEKMCLFSWNLKLWSKKHTQILFRVFLNVKNVDAIRRRPFAVITCQSVNYGKDSWLWEVKRNDIASINLKIVSFGRHIPEIHVRLLLKNIKNGNFMDCDTKWSSNLLLLYRSVVSPFCVFKRRQKNNKEFGYSCLMIICCCCCYWNRKIHKVKECFFCRIFENIK